MSRPYIIRIVLLAAAISAAASPALADQPTTSDITTNVADRDGFRVFVMPAELITLQGENGGLVIVDARDAAEYELGHIPWAINIPGRDLRTSSVRPGEGDSQYIFLTPEGRPDIGRYEQILSEAGLTRDRPVVVYGNHAGREDGSVVAMLLDWLGQEEVYYLDGVGMSEWQKAGFAVSQGGRVLKPAEYVAEPRDNFLWTFEDVRKHLGTGEVVFYDTRSAQEFTGEDLRGNRRGGHIPGAVHADYADLLDADKRVLHRDEVVAIFASHGLEAARRAGKPIVLYCQTSTRVSLPYLLLRDLGYENVFVYDASWHEYGNRDDAQIAKP